MTCKEKYMKDYPDADVDWHIRFKCPSDYGYLPDPYNCDAATDTEAMSCETCWNRELPEENKEEVKRMTCLEKYKKEHPLEYDECNKVVYDHCPCDYGYLADPVNCQSVSSYIDFVTCEECWNREIPEEKKLNDRIDEACSLNPTISPDELKGAVVAMSKILDSGNRREFKTGAVRDIQEGKGRCDLMPLDVVAHFSDKVIEYIARFKDTGDIVHLYNAIDRFISQNFKTRYDAFLEVAKHFEEGAKKYGDNNWQKGIPVRCYIDSALRHYFKFKRYDRDEPHNRAFLWNLMCCIWTCIHKPELNEYRKENE